MTAFHVFYYKFFNPNTNTIQFEEKNDFHEIRSISDRKYNNGAQFKVLDYKCCRSKKEIQKFTNN